MQKNYLWTGLKARLQVIRTTSGATLNWVFLAGGPGLGSESLAPLTQLLYLPGTIWHLDLPGDGSNRTADDACYFSKWSAALIEACTTLDNVILVAHSTGGMYALATAELEKHLLGLVLMDSAPDASWQQHFANILTQFPIAGLTELHNIYADHPNNKVLKELTILSAPYLFTKQGLTKDLSFLENLPYNFRTCEWSAQNFDSTYKAQWIPQSIPTLIFAGEQDQITPLQFFSNYSAFIRPNIFIKAIENAAHFPWIENPAKVVELLTEFACVFTNCTYSK